MVKAFNTVVLKLLTYTNIIGYFLTGKPLIADPCFRCENHGSNRRNSMMTMITYLFNQVTYFYLT